MLGVIAVWLFFGTMSLGCFAAFFDGKNTRKFRIIAVSLCYIAGPIGFFAIGFAAITLIAVGIALLVFVSVILNPILWACGHEVIDF